MASHLLHHGLPLCVFTVKVPRSWPPGHTWASLDDYLKNPKLTDCQDCIWVFHARKFTKTDGKWHWLPPSPNF